jgi:hypothetical protein
MRTMGATVVHRRDEHSHIESVRVHHLSIFNFAIEDAEGNLELWMDFEIEADVSSSKVTKCCSGYGQYIFLVSAEDSYCISFSATSDDAESMDNQKDRDDGD